jgi:hypothetical protein
VFFRGGATSYFHFLLVADPAGHMGRSMPPGIEGVAMKESVHEYDVFADDLIQEEGSQAQAAIGLWGITLLHVMKVAFVIYSGAHCVLKSKNLPPG